MTSKCRSANRVILAALMICTATAMALSGQTFTTLVNFNGANGISPAALTQGTDGNFYGVAAYGGTSTACGPNGCGTVFKMTPNGSITTLHNFKSTDGSGPIAGLVLGTNGAFYGTTSSGSAGYGTVFRMSSAGRITTLHSFALSDGANPNGLLQAADGKFYGTTSQGGATANYGTIFVMTPAGALTTMYSFDFTDGAYPVDLVQAGNGIFYGVTPSGGSSAACFGAPCGTIFKMTGGKVTTLYNFSVAPFSGPGIFLTANAGVYGTTEYGGANGLGSLFSIASTGKFTTLFSFGNGGGLPMPVTIQATDGNSYGSTLDGGTSGSGTIFVISSAGALDTLYSFANPYPWVSSLIQSTDGKIYGTTSYGGADNDGTAFSLDVGLGPFVKTVPTSGKTGSRVTILGTNLTGATSVTFNGTPVTSFTVTSTGSAISTTVPTGATTGKVQVVTPTATLTSNVVFRVR